MFCGGGKGEEEEGERRRRKGEEEGGEWRGGRWEVGLRGWSGKEVGESEGRRQVKEGESPGGRGARGNRGKSVLPSVPLSTYLKVEYLSTYLPLTLRPACPTILDA